MTEAHIGGFGGRGGQGSRPALVVVDVTLGFTDPDSPSPATSNARSRT